LGQHIVQIKGRCVRRNDKTRAYEKMSIHGIDMHDIHIVQNNKYIYKNGTYEAF